VPRQTTACWPAPRPRRWLDGFQHFVGAPYSPGLCVVVDVRYVVPAAGGSAPAGWALLPVFERCGAFVASGTYHLPLFQVCMKWTNQPPRSHAGGREAGHWWHHARGRVKRLVTAALLKCSRVQIGECLLPPEGAAQPVARFTPFPQLHSASCFAQRHEPGGHVSVTPSHPPIHPPHTTQGVPGSTLLAEVAARGDPHAVMVAQIKVRWGHTNHASIILLVSPPPWAKEASRSAQPPGPT
jgi:hypothetical protein